MHVIQRGMTLLAVSFLLSLAGCATGGGGGGGGNGPSQNENSSDGGNDNNAADNDQPPPVASSAVVKTRIQLGTSNGKVDVGDDVIVYGIDSQIEDEDEPLGVHFIIPSESDSQTASGTMIPGSDALFGARHFKVAGRKVALVRSTSAISIFDVDTGRLVDIPPTELTLHRDITEPGAPGQMTSDGPFIAAVSNTTGFLFGGSEVVIIDVSGDEPEVLHFPRPEEFDEDGADFDQVVVNAATRRVIGFGNNNLYMYDLDNPDSQPTKFDFGFDADNGRVSEEVQIRFDGQHVIYHDDSNFEPVVSLLNVNDGTIIHFDDNPTAGDAPLALAAGSFGYFLFREDADNESGSFKTNVYRSAIGRTDDAPSATLANQLDHYDFRPTDVDEPGAEQDLCLGEEKKLIGYGATLCITPDGEQWFLAGWSSIDARYDHIQVSRGGVFSDIPDPERTTYTGSLMGTDIVCSADIVAFRGLREVDDVVACGTTTHEVIAFIRLQQFDQ